MASFAASLHPRSNSLNALRLGLAFVVILSHSWALGGYGAEPRFGGEKVGTWAVFAFFALSGYLIAGSRVNNDLVGYLQRRILRIYPAFVVCLLVTVMVFAPIGYYAIHHTLDGYATAKPTPINYVLSNLKLKMETYNVAQTPDGIPHEHAWTGSMWSLQHEFASYLIIGLLGCWAAFKKRPAIVVTLLVLVTAARIETVPIMRVAQNSDLFWLMQLLPFFVAGSVLYMVRERLPCRADLAALSLALLVILPLAMGNRFVVLTALPLAYLLMWLGAVVPISLGRRHDISYGIYIYGFAVQQLLAVFGLHRHGQLLFVVLSVVCTIPFAVASWFLVERPAMRLRPARPAEGSTQPVVTTESRLEPAGASRP